MFWNEKFNSTMINWFMKKKKMIGKLGIWIGLQRLRGAPLPIPHNQEESQRILRNFDWQQITVVVNETVGADVTVAAPIVTGTETGTETGAKTGAKTGTVAVAGTGVKEENRNRRKGKWKKQSRRRQHTIDAKVLCWSNWKACQREIEWPLFSNCILDLHPSRG